MSSAPRVTIGLPVYNGSNYVGEAIESMLNQTFGDFELIISDNASTDSTEEICRSYAKTDARIRYSRLDSNIGAAGNFNRVFDDCRSDFFKWAAHDDLCLPTFLQRCVETLDGAPANVALCMPRTIVIDAQGRTIEEQDNNLDLRSSGATGRMRMFASRILASGCHSVFGLLRTDVLRKTRLIQPFVASDIVLLAELATAGPLWEIPDRLFCARIHPGCSHQKFKSNGLQAYSEWYDPANSRKATPRLRTMLVLEQLSVISKSSLSPLQKIACSGAFTTAWYCREARVELGAAKRKLWSRLSRMGKRQAQSCGNG